MIGRLYIKIFLFFIVLLAVAGLLVGVLFHLGPEKNVRDLLENIVETMALMTADVIREHLTAGHDEPIAENKGLQKALHRLSVILESDVWLTDSNGNTVIKTFDGDPPADPVMVPEYRLEASGRIPVYSRIIIPKGVHIGFPLDTEQGRVGIHVVLRKKDGEHNARGFFIGLSVIGLIIAAIVFPISRTITKPVNRLRKSALRIAEGDLSHRADVRTRDEIGSLGRAFNQMADKVERMIRGGRELTANMSHELRTPLARIRVAGELLEQKLGGSEDSGVRKYLESIREDVDELDRLIGRLLDLSKQDLREEAPRLESIDSAGLLTELLARYEPALAARSLVVETDFANDCILQVDPAAMKTALSAVMDNAVRFTPDGSGIQISTAVEDGWTVIRVANVSTTWPDDGHWQDLFEPFNRAPRNQGGGYGLGLAIARKIVEKHGGKITAERDEDWFVIEIRLPLKHHRA